MKPIYLPILLFLVILISCNNNHTRPGAGNLERGKMGPNKEYQAHNEMLENSPEFQAIIDDVMNEVYTTYAKNHIIRAEVSLKLMKVSDDSTSYKEAQQKLENAKMLLHTNPYEAARLYYQIGTCHRIWAHKQRILKEKYGMTWYTPTEVNPHIIFD